MPASLKRYLPAVCCSVLLALCALLAQPYAELGMCDDWSYVRTAQLLAQTGHLVYIGWASAMVGWQFYFGALFIKLFGFSFTATRMSVLAISVVTAFLLQRTFVRAGLGQWNASLATLTLVLSPLFMPLAVTFMTDVPALFVIVLCLYSCLRALQAGSARSTLAWLCFACVSNALGGTVRQVAWLGILVLIPCTLWLLRHRPKVVLACVPVLLASVASMFGFMHWYTQQPYSIPESMIFEPLHPWRIRGLIEKMIAFFFEFPLFLLPVLLVFVPRVFSRTERKNRLLAVGCFGGMLLFSALLAFSRFRPGLEPVLLSYVTPAGILSFFPINGTHPVVLTTPIRLALTALVFLGVFGLLMAVLTRRGHHLPPAEGPAISFRHLCILLLPFSAAYVLLLFPRALYWVLFDRYLFFLLLVALVLIVRFYQDRIAPRLPVSCLMFTALIAIYSVTGTHDLFSMYRAQLAAVQQVRAAGVPANHIDGGFEFNALTQVEQTGFVNEANMPRPAGAYKPLPVRASFETCHAAFDHYFPSIDPRYAVSLDPDLCLGPAGFPPVRYQTWLPRRTIPIYIIKYAPHPLR